MYDWSTPMMAADGKTEMVQWIGQDGSKGPPVTLGFVCATAICTPLEGQQDAAAKLAQFGWAAAQMQRVPDFVPSGEEIERIKLGLPRAFGHAPYLIYQVMTIIDPGDLPERMRPKQ